MVQIHTKRKTRDEILALSVPLFAEHGYDGVSMRDVAGVAGVSPAALYYHFPDKEHLYFDVVAHECREKAAALKTDADNPASPWEQIEKFINNLTRLAATDEDFMRLMQWVRLDCDEIRRQKLAEHVFRDLFVDVYDLAAKLNTRFDAHMLAMSIVGLVLFSLESRKISKFMPGHRPEQDDPAVLSQHVIELLQLGLTNPKGRRDMDKPHSETLGTLS
ncbi:MAG: TetR/AcrR family transcriptional regulator [Pseudomonadota bacterium]